MPSTRLPRTAAHASCVVYHYKRMIPRPVARLALVFAFATLSCANRKPPPRASLPPTEAVHRDAARPGQGCASEPLRTSGRIHYVCDCQAGAAPGCTPGSDDNRGTTPTRPLRSYSKAAEAFASMNAGDSVAFCRGGRWNLTGGAGWANANCRKDNTCDIRDYAPPWGGGGEAKPSIAIDGGSTGATLMTFIHPPQHFEGYRVLNLDLHGSSSDTAIFFFNETTDVDLCSLSTDGFGISVQVSGGDSPSFGVSSNIVLRNSRITNNTNIAYLAVCDHCTVDNNFFDNNGARDTRTHTIYFASQAYNVNGRTVVHTSQGMRLSRNEIHYSKQPCMGAPVVVHGRHQDVVIEDNVVDAASASDQCWGPGVGCGGYGYGCWFRNTVVRNNVFRTLGNVGSDDSNCTGCTIENNLFVMNRNGTAISVGGTKPRPEGDPSYSQWDGSPDDASSSVLVRNNTFYFTESATSATAITISSGNGHVLENNAIAFAAAKPNGSTCYQLAGAPTLVLAGADYNLCSLRGDSWASYPPNSGTSLAHWQEAGFDRHSKQANSMFSDPPAEFVPAAGSPLIDAADPSNSPKNDLVRKPRDPHPDIGAYER